MIDGPSAASQTGGYKQARKVGVKDIARTLGLSIGTVDRALHNRGEINPLTRQRVLAMAETLGYKPNLAARYLKSKRKLSLSINLPVGTSTFYDAIRKGIRDAAGPLDMAVQLEFRTHSRLGEGDAKLIDDAIAEGANGIILAPGNPQALRPLIRRAAQRKIPVVCVATDAPGTERLTTVSADPYISGAMAAELLSRICPQGRSAAVVTGFWETMDHAEKLRGFKESLSCSGGSLQFAEVVETHDDPREAQVRTQELLEKHPGLDAMYVSTGNSISVLQAIEKAGRMGSMAIVTTDLFPELGLRIRKGAVFATLYQRPFSQGRLAFQALYRFLMEGKCPPGRIKLLPHVVMRSNLDLILEKLRE